MATSPITDGIRPSVTRGQIGRTWWGKRFVAAFERGVDPRRAAAARRTAQRGDAVTMAWSAGTVEAEFAAADGIAPYARLNLKPTPGRTADAVGRDLAETAGDAAGLLARALPEPLADLLPAPGELRLDCSCGDWPPCVHGLALAYLAADRIDADPLLLLLLRGIERDALLEALWRSYGVAPARLDAPPEPEPLQVTTDFYRQPEWSCDLSDLEDDPDALASLGTPPFFPPSEAQVIHTLRALRDGL